MAERFTEKLVEEQETVKRSIKEAARRQKQWVDTSLLDETVMKMS